MAAELLLLGSAEHATGRLHLQRTKLPFSTMSSSCSGLVELSCALLGLQILQQANLT